MLVKSISIVHHGYAVSTGLTQSHLAFCSLYRPDISSILIGLLSITGNFLAWIPTILIPLRTSEEKLRKPLLGGFGCDELVLYGIGLLA